MVERVAMFAGRPQTVTRNLVERMFACGARAWAVGAPLPGWDGFDCSDPRRGQQESVTQGVIDWGTNRHPWAPSWPRNPFLEGVATVTQT